MGGFIYPLPSVVDCGWGDGFPATLEELSWAKNLMVSVIGNA